MGSICRNAASRIVLVTVLSVTAGGFFVSAHARLGETRGELSTPEGRYGEPTGETTPVLENSLEKVDVFEKDKIGISTEYDSDGKVWRITYHKKDLSETLINNLLKKNGGERKWSKPILYRYNKHWVSEDKQVHAVYYGNPVYKLVIMTHTAMRTKRMPQSLAGTTTTRVSDGKGGVKIEKKTEDPLEGF